LRGQNALAEARAAGSDVEDTRLQLVESTRMAFYDYFLVERALEVNRQNLDLLREFRSNAESRYKTGQVTQQDVLQADVEIGRQRERLLTLERIRPVAVARLNTLMHSQPNSAPWHLRSGLIFKLWQTGSKPNGRRWHLRARNTNLISK
jgi:outer membrane protein TolC